MSRAASDPGAGQPRKSKPSASGGEQKRAPSSTSKMEKLKGGAVAAGQDADEPDPDEIESAGGELPEWVDRAFPWIASFLLHAGVLLLFIFAYNAITTLTKKQHPEPIIVPQGLQQKFSNHPGGIPHPGHNNNPTRSARQDLQKLTSHAWNTNKSPKVTSLLNSSNKSLNIIAVGPNGGTSSGGGLAPFGVPGGGMGDGPQSAFLGRGGNARRIVYIIDHEGDMLENFSFLKAQLQSSIGKLVPLQSFAVIIFRKNYSILGPPRLMHATLHNKNLFYKRLADVAPHGRAEYRFERFYRPFQAAFDMHPQIIYFLTSGAFDPRLIAAVAKLNSKHTAHIFTYAFTNNDPTFTKNLKLLASQNGGEYRYISRADAGG